MAAIQFQELDIVSGGKIQTATGIFTSLVPSGCAFSFDAVSSMFTGNVLCLNTDGVEIAYVSAAGDGYFAGSLSSVGLDVNGAAITNVADPTNNQDAATKHYVDTRPGSGQVIPRFTANGYYRVDTNVDGVYVVPRNGTIANISFGNSFSNTPVVLVSSSNYAALDTMRDQQSDGWYFDYGTVSTSGFSINTGKTWTAGYGIILSYIVIGV